MLKGITITLYEKTESGRDSFNVPVYREDPVQVDNVLVAPASNTSATEELNLEGKIAIYTLGIPKGDTHEWEDRTVEFFGRKWKTIGPVIEGIEALVPTAWHKKIQVARYE